MTDCKLAYNLSDATAPVSLLDATNVLIYGAAAAFSAAACRSFKKFDAKAINNKNLYDELTKELRIFRPLSNSQEKEFLHPVLLGRVYKCLFAKK